MTNGGNKMKLENNLNSKYNYWQTRIISLIIIGYASFYLLRQNFVISIPYIQDEFHLCNTDVGMVLSGFSIVYGIGKLVNGYLSDLSNPKIFISIGLLCSAILTGLMGISYNFICISFLFILNGWPQSMGFPPIVKLLPRWFQKDKLGTSWSLCTASSQLGGVLIILISSFFISSKGWRLTLYIPTIIALIISFYLYKKLIESPEKIGLPWINHDNAKQRNNHLYIFDYKKLFFNKMLWHLCFANLFVYFIKVGIFNWAPIFLRVLKGSNTILIGGQSALYETAGLVGTLMSGIISDKIFKGERNFLSIICMLMLSICLMIFLKNPKSNIYMDALLIFLCGIFIQIPQVLTGLSSIDCIDKRLGGTANGIVGLFGYIGSAISGALIGYISDQFGWEITIYFFIAFSILGTLLFTSAYSASKKFSKNI